MKKTVKYLLCGVAFVAACVTVLVHLVAAYNNDIARTEVIESTKAVTEVISNSFTEDEEDDELEGPMYFTGTVRYACGTDIFTNETTCKRVD